MRGQQLKEKERSGYKIMKASFRRFIQIKDQLDINGKTHSEEETGIAANEKTHSGTHSGKGSAGDQ